MLWDLCSSILWYVLVGFVSFSFFFGAIYDKVLFFEFVLCFAYVLMNWVFFVFSFKLLLLGTS
jgi:hypothetical protein